MKIYVNNLIIITVLYYEHHVESAISKRLITIQQPNQYMFELIVFFTSFKYIFVEGGEQALVGLSTASKIGLRYTVKITILGFAVGIILYFVFLKISGFVPTNLLEIALGVGLVF